MISGKVEGLVYSSEEDFRWVPIKAGDVFHVPGGARHGWRNQGRDPAVMILITTSRLGTSFKEVGRPAVPGKPSPPPSPEEIQRFLKTSDKYRVLERDAGRKRPGGDLAARADLSRIVS